MDGLRAIAVAGVLVAHYLPTDNVIQFMPWGLLGVQLFFVISGFLITGILLDARGKAKNSDVLKAFYMRRFLRIIPPYYLLLAIYSILGVSFASGTLLASALYYLNIFESAFPGEYPYIGHFWTLCIEEQFYLVWPWVIIFLPRSKLLIFTILAMLFAPTSRVLLDLAGLPYLSIRNLPTSALDSLGGGALLALMHHGYAPRLMQWWQRYYGWLFALGLLLYFATHFNTALSISHLWIGLFGTAICGMSAVHYSTLNYDTLFDRFLTNRCVQYIGKISYGIYLYQFLTLFPLYKLVSILGHPTILKNDYIYALTWTSMTIATAAISWHCFERPLLRLKKLFQYTSGKAA